MQRVFQNCAFTSIIFVSMIFSYLSFSSTLQVNNVPVQVLPVSYPGQSHPLVLPFSDDLPRTVIANLNQGSAVKSLDFHPIHQTLLLG